MKTRNTILLLVLAAGLAAFVIFFEAKQPSTREAEQINAAVIVFDPDAVDGIIVTNNENTIELHRRNDAWYVDAPLRDRADWKAVGQLIAVAALLQKEATLDKVDKDFGVVNSNVRLKFLGKDAPPEIFFGKEAAVDGKVYMRLAGQNTACVARDVLKKLVMQKVDDFRDHRLTDINLPQVNKLVVKSQAGEIELQKDRDRWQLDKPIKARADNQKVDGMVSQIIGAQIEAFVPENEANTDPTGLSDPRGTISVFTEEGDKPSILQIGQASETGKLYAWLSSRDSVYLLSSSFARVIETRPNDLRDRHLLPLNLDIVDRIHIEPAGKPEILLARKIEDWVVKGSPDTSANGAEVKRLARLVQDQQVEAFVADVASDLQKYGLNQPQLKVTFSSFASENTAETQAGEHPIGTISFGNIDGDHVYARLENEPFVVSVGISMLNSILTDPAQWRALPVFKFKPEEIVSVELEREGRPPVAFARDSKAGWTLTKGEGRLDQVAVESLCNTLASLRAVRWTSSGTDGLGFEKPALVLSFTTADKKTTRLTVGSLAHESMWNATTDAIPGAFILSRTDMEPMQAQFVNAAP